MSSLLPPSGSREWVALAQALEEAPAPCERSGLPDAWWDLAGPFHESAVQCCDGCPVRRECLEYALAADERYGIWGGKTPEERARGRAG